MTSHTLERRPLGTTRQSVTPIGIGGAYLGMCQENGQRRTDDDLGAATVLHALELGINLIDTSAGYMGGGRSERIVGQALRQWLDNGGERSDIVVETKTGTRDRRNRTASSYTAAATWESIETSLDALNVEYLDVALVHDPMDLDPVLAPGGAWTALQEMRSQGLVRAIGLGTRRHDYHRRMMETGACDVCLTHSDFQLIRQEARVGVLEPAAEHGVGVLNGTSLAHGMLVGRRPPTEIVSGFHDRWRVAMKRRPEFAVALDRAQALWDWTKSRDINLLALNLQYIAREPRISATLLGASTPEQIEMDVAALTEQLPDGVWGELTDAMPWLQRGGDRG